MFIETILAMLLIGAIAGAVVYELLVADPLREDNAATAARHCLRGAGRPPAVRTGQHRRWHR